MSRRREESLFLVGDSDIYPLSLELFLTFLSCEEVTLGVFSKREISAGLTKGVRVATLFQRGWSPRHEKSKILEGFEKGKNRSSLKAFGKLYAGKLACTAWEENAVFIDPCLFF